MWKSCILDTPELHLQQVQCRPGWIPVFTLRNTCTPWQGSPWHKQLSSVGRWGHASLGRHINFLCYSWLKTFHYTVQNWECHLTPKMIHRYLIQRPHDIKYCIFSIILCMTSLVNRPPITPVYIGTIWYMLISIQCGTFWSSYGEKKDDLRVVLSSIWCVLNKEPWSIAAGTAIPLETP
jgi:hypothetical protein